MTPGAVAHPCNLSTGEVEVGGSACQVLFALHSEPRASLTWGRSYLKELSWRGQKKKEGKKTRAKVWFLAL